MQCDSRKRKRRKEGREGGKKEGKKGGRETEIQSAPISSVNGDIHQHYLGQKKCYWTLGEGMVVRFSVTGME